MAIGSRLFLIVSGLLAAFSGCRATQASAARSTADTDSSGVVQRIRALEAELARAVVARDVAALRRIEAPSYVYTDSDAKMSTRDEFIREYEQGTSTVHALRFDSLVVDVYSNVAIVRGILTADRMTDGVRIRRSSRYTRVYVPCATSWCAVVGHSSTLRR